MLEPTHENLGQQVVIRRFQPQDQGAVFNVYCNTLLKMGKLTAGRIAHFEDIQKTYLDNKGEFLVGEVDGKIVATGGYMADDRRPVVAVIKRMYTHFDKQGQGIGRKILEQLENSIKQKSQYKKMELFTANEMEAAQKLYEKLGFTKAQEQSQSNGFLYEKPIVS